MNIYIVLECIAYEGDDIEKIYSKREDADQYAKEKNDQIKQYNRKHHYYKVEEWEVSN